MAKLNWFLSLKNMAKSDETAKQLLESINSAESEELKEKAKLEAREYIESFADSEPEKPAEPEPIVEPEHIEVESKVEQAKQELEVDLDTPEDTGERPELQPPVNNDLIARIERRQKIAEENARKRRNAPITLKEQIEWSKQKAREIDERNERMRLMREQIKEQVAKAQAEAKANNSKNMVGLLTILLRELKLNIRLEVICKKHGFTREDLDKLKANNPAGWEQCVAVRKYLEKEVELYIH
jgi:hypothetical protein